MKKISVFLFLIITVACSFEQDEDSNLMSLEGEWSFKMDPLDQGIKDEWQNINFNESVHLPGSMAENAKGDEVTVSTSWIGTIVDKSWFTEDKYAKYRQPDNLKIPFWLKPVKHYIGPAWYKKVVDLPKTWNGKRILLHLERCHWETTVFINGQATGSQNSLGTAHEYDITPHIKSVKNQICIRVDNRMIIPVGINSHSVSDHNQSNWNGIVGQINLKAVSPVNIEDVQIYPDIHRKNVNVVITLSNYNGNPFEGHLEIEAEGSNSENNHVAEKDIQQINFTGKETRLETEYFMGEEVLLWSEFDPALYKLKVRLIDRHNDLLDYQSIDFGMREFKAAGRRFHVNGRPVFLRGTTECLVFPLTGYPPTDTKSWEKIIKRCQEHGFNHMRFHSWCPPEAAFIAADKLGFYFQVPGSFWVNYGDTIGIGDGNPVDNFIYEESDRILKAYGNHPSFVMMTYGNEPAGENRSEYLGKLVNYWKSKDKRRVYTCAAGWPIIPESDFHLTSAPRIQLWGAGLNSIINSEPPQTMFDFYDIISKYSVPYVSHEIGQWCAYPNFNEIPKYTGVLKPTNFEIFQETLIENHMGDLAGDFLLASGKLQTLCYKAELEAALRTPEFAGFQMLQINDYPGEGTALVGILDAFYGSKGYVSPEEFRKFCNETVLLARMEKRVFQNDEIFQADMEIAHFGEKPIKNPKIICQIFNSERNSLVKEEFTVEEIEIDNGIDIGAISFPLFDVAHPQKLTLEVLIEDSEFSNSWDFWVYPKKLEVNPSESVHITKSLDSETIRILKQGGSVLLLPYGHIADEKGAKVQIGFSSIFWNTAWTRGQAPHTLGILCNPEHPVFNDFPTEYHSNWQWWDPVTYSQVMILDDYPAEMKPLIQPIDTWFENRRLALAFEARTENGKLLVCSIDMQNKLEDRPASRQLYYSIIEYMNSDSFNPRNKVELTSIRDLLND